MAISFGLQLAMDKGFRVVEVETDSLMAVKEISKNSSSFCIWGSIISDIYNLLAVGDSSYIRHVRRGCNYFAHNLAKMSNVVDDCSVWWRELPHDFCNPDFVMS